MPGKGAFKRCVESVEAKGSAYSPRGVCAAAGRKKYGKKRFQEMAKAGKRRAARAKSNPTVPKELQKAVDTFTAYFPPTAALGLIPESSRKSRKSRKFQNPSDEIRLGSGVVRLWSNEGRKWDAHLYGDNGEQYIRRVAHGVTEATARKKASEALAGRQKDIGKYRTNPTKRNPVDAAIEAFEEFHGEAPKTIKEFSTKVHYHGTTAGIGELIKLKIRLPRDREIEGGRVVTLKGFKGAMLTENPQKTQLFIEGGDQELDLSVFGIDDPHEVEHLGECIEVTYFTTKKHLGRDGGTANYVHRFGGEPGEPKTPRPQMIYRVRDKVIEFAGGGYTIPAEGIDG